MGLRKIIPMLVAGALAVGAIAGFINYQSVFAQSTDPTETAPAQADQLKRDPGRLPGGKHGGVADEQLASALGITVEELQAAQQTAREQALKQAVSQGLITQEQADDILANSSQGRMPGGLRFKGMDEIDHNALLAEALGITTEELDSARQKAFTTSIDQAVADGNLTQEQADVMKARSALAADKTFQASMKSAYESAIQQAVKNGVITQAQADSILADAPNGFGRGGFGEPGMGRHGKHGGEPLTTTEQ